MKIKHYQGYGVVNAQRIKDNATLHIKVTGNHEYGIHRDDEYDICNWLVTKFDKTEVNYLDWHKKRPQITLIDGYEDGVETCDYIINY